MTSAPAGTVTLGAAAASTTRSTVMTIAWLASICPDLLSNKCPALIASVFGAGGQLKIPPSAPTHGVGPAPRHGAGGTAGPCADAVAAITRTPQHQTTSFFIAGPL